MANHSWERVRPTETVMHLKKVLDEIHKELSDIFMEMIRRPCDTDINTTVRIKDLIEKLKTTEVKQDLSL